MDPRRISTLLSTLAIIVPVVHRRNSARPCNQSRPTNAVPDTGLRRISSHAIRQWSIDPLLDGLLAELCTSMDISTNCVLVVVNEAPSHKPLIFCCSSPLSMYKTFDMRQQSNSCSPANEDGAPHASDSHADSLFLKGPLDGRRKRSNREIILS
ncbi:hypothetical protein BHE74_00048708 [Ensete ventricosum]|nr:hypothetical protein BHE74_00048708 [Ensete ventricosum]RZS12532.1 hypothetical protein BHM03_00044001 [Ensete ventricosum]